MPTKKSSTLAKQQKQHFKWYYVVILIGIVAIVGIVILRFSHAGQANNVVYFQNGKLGKVSLDGSQNEQINTGTIAKSILYGLSSPDQTKIVFQATTAALQYPYQALFIYDTQVKTPVTKQITTPPSGGQSADVGPVWSPDGARIAFARSGNGAGAYIISSDGSNIKQLYSGVVGSGAVQWSPDGKLLMVDMNGTTRIYNTTNSAPAPQYGFFNGHAIQWLDNNFAILQKDQSLFLAQGLNLAVNSVIANDAFAGNFNVHRASYCPQDKSVIYIDKTERSIKKVTLDFTNTKPLGTATTILSTQSSVSYYEVQCSTTDKTFVLSELSPSGGIKRIGLDGNIINTILSSPNTQLNITW